MLFLSLALTILVAVSDVTCSSNATYTPGLRVTYGTSGTIGETYYYEIALNVTAATAAGLVQVGAPRDTPVRGLGLFCPPADYTVCPFYDDTGYIAGVQISFGFDKLLDPIPRDLTKNGYITWSPPATDAMAANVYWTIQQFFVTEETLQTSAEERLALRESHQTLLYNDNVWIVDFDGSLKNITDEAGLAANDYSRESCIVGMGRHYFYDYDNKNLSCADMSPWFPLTSSGGGVLVANGLMVFGNLTYPDSSQRDWYENQSEATIKQVVSDAPQCLYELANDTTTTIHVYYVAEPWNIDCDEE